MLNSMIPCVISRCHDPALAGPSMLRGMEDAMARKPGNRTIRPDSLFEYCSWCFARGEHRLVEDNFLTRNVYKCTGCRKRTVQCRYCECMAKGTEDWDDECCAEHDGTIASFASLTEQLKDISGFGDLFEPASVNMVTVGKYAAFGLGGAVIALPVTLLAAPALASAAGAAGLLGAAGTGTAISSLSGAALTSASLAAIGGGTMAAGTAVITATGAALGATQGGLIANSYFGDIEGFAIRRIRKGRKHGVIVVNGFLSENETDTGDWEAALKKHFPGDAWYHLDWEAKRLRDLGGLFGGSFNKLKGSAAIGTAAKRAAKAAGKRLGPATAFMVAADIADNPWHVAMFRAQQTGVLLAEAISRTPDWTFTLAGHSLGARVIYYALQALSTNRRKPVRDVFLLGGAVDRTDRKGWSEAVKPVRGRIYNCFSGEDAVLGTVYRTANAFMSDPIGFSGIPGRNPGIHNFDCTDLVPGHMEWKHWFGEILSQLRT